MRVFLQLILAGSAIFPAEALAQKEQEPKGFVYESKIEEDRNEVLMLENGAVVEVNSYLGYVGYRKDAVLFFLNSGCRIWVEGKRVYRCTLLREPPEYARKTSAELVWIEKVSGEGDVLILDDGSVFEVMFQSYVTGIWLPGEAILMDDSRILHLDVGDEIVDVMRLR